jgi:putative ABC transport system permease protein
MTREGRKAMFLTKLAFKNLIRHQNRTLITALIIALAVFFYIMFDSLIGGMVEISYDNIIDYESAHLQFAAPAYWEEKDELPLEDLLLPAEKREQMLAEYESVEAAAAELNFQARLNNGQNELPVIAKAVQADNYLKLFKLEEQFVSGEFFSGESSGAVLGKKLAELMNLETGDYLTLLFKDKNDTFNTLDLEISGLIHTANPNLNRNFVYLPLKQAQAALNLDNQYSKEVIRLKNKDEAGELAAELNSSYFSNGEIRAYPWNELEAITFAGVKQSANQMIMVVILLIAAIAIINTVILAALERMREIGMMKALGLQNKEIVYSFVLESLGIAVLGSVIGVMLGWVGVFFLSKYGLDFTALTRMDMSSFGIPIIGKLYGVWNLKVFAEVSLFALLVSFTASIPPAYWAAKKNPVDAIERR